MTVVRSSFGFASLKEPPVGGYRKVLIAGLGRSGTSSIASMLRNAGFYLGEVEGTATREDPTLRDLLAKGQIAEIRSILDDWASKHDLIAWKDPKLVGDQGRQLAHSLPADWAVIIIFRDPLATTMRLVSQHGGDLVERLSAAVRRQKKLLKMVEETQKTLLLVSYEKLMSQPIQVCGDLLNFLAPNIASGLDLTAVWEKTKADQKLYRSEAERSRVRGSAPNVQPPPENLPARKSPRKTLKPAGGSGRKQRAKPAGGGGRKQRAKPAA